MALKLTFSASETLSDLILHTLQNHGLEKAEALEQAFYNELERLPASSGTGNLNKNIFPNDGLKIATVDNKFIVLYHSVSSETVVLDICHISRYAAAINS